MPHNLLVNSGSKAPGLVRLRFGEGSRLSGRFLAFPILVSLSPLSCLYRLTRRPSLRSPPRTACFPLTQVASPIGAMSPRWERKSLSSGMAESGQRNRPVDADRRCQAAQLRREIDAFFSSGVDAAYEIARGKKMKGGRYAFPVTLFLSIPTQSSPTQASAAEIRDCGGSGW